MIKKERGVTLIVLVVTIIIMLILASIGIGAFNYNHRDVMETSENLVKSNTKQDYIDAVQMVISETQLKYATKEVDSGYFNEIIKILSDSGQFAGAVITPVYYDVTSDGVNIDEKSEKVNGIDIYTKEGFHILINEDFKIYGADNVKYAQLENAQINFISSVPLTKWTNQNIQIEIKRGGEFSADSQYTIQYKIAKNSDYQKYTTPLNIPENCEIYARIIDKDRRIIAPEQKAEVTKIDKIDPQINSFNVTANCSTTEATVDAQDNESGIDKIIIYAKKTDTNTSVTKELDLETKKVSLELASGTYDVYAEAYDKAGNTKKTSTQTITTTGHNPVYVGTADVHTKCSYCETVLSSTHTMTNTKSASVCQKCVCGYKITTHTPVNGGTKDAHKKCSKCTYVIQGESSHSYTTTTQAATCTVGGYKKYTCGCGYTYQDTINATGHDMYYYISSSKTYTKSHPSSTSVSCIRKCKNCTYKTNDSHKTTSSYYNSDSTGADKKTYQHYVKCTITWKGGTTQNCYMADNGGESGSCYEKYTTLKHKCKYCSSTPASGSYAFSGRCKGKGTSSSYHKHVCTYCGKEGSTYTYHDYSYSTSNAYYNTSKHKVTKYCACNSSSVSYHKIKASYYDYKQHYTCTVSGCGWSN